MPSAPANPAPTWDVINNLPPGVLHDGLTVYNSTLQVGTVTFNDNELLNACVWDVISTADAPAQIKLDFVEGWIWSGSSIPQTRLLQHEQLHWAIAQAIVAFYTPILNAVIGESAHSDVNLFVARTQAHTGAANNLQTHLDAVFDSYMDFSELVQNQYDSETNGGELPPPGQPDPQADWNANYQAKIEYLYEP
jgi:hypothetical protein